MSLLSAATKNHVGSRESSWLPFQHGAFLTESYLRYQKKHLEMVKSQDHRMVWVGRDLCRCPHWPRRSPGISRLWPPLLEVMLSLQQRCQSSFRGWGSRWISVCRGGKAGGGDTTALAVAPGGPLGELLTHLSTRRLIDAKGKGTN